MNLKLFKKLTQLHGVSGYEKDVSSFIKKEMEQYVDETITDTNGNLILFKKGSAKNKKKILFAAHMDEIGFQVVKIEENGTLMYKQLGSCWIYTTYQSRVMFKNGTVGIISSRVRPEKVDNQHINMFIDIGCSSKEEAEKLVEVGDVATYIGEYTDMAGECLTAKAIDDRVGCFMQMQALMDIAKPKNDIYMAFTVQEEVGTRGGGVVAHRVKPDIGIAVDVTPAHDRPGDLEGSNTLGAGCAIKISDNSSISDEYLVETAVTLCKKNKIDYQKDVIYVGGTDAGAMNRTGDGVKTIGFSTVTRYTHGPSAIVSKKDIKSTIELIEAYMNHSFEF